MGNKAKKSELRTATISTKEFLLNAAKGRELAEEYGRCVVVDEDGTQRMMISSNRASAAFLPDDMVAVYYWEGAPFRLYCLDVADSDTETFLQACKDKEYPIPDSGTEVLFLQNNEIVDHRLI